jgi:hypothetical protein
MYVAQLPQDIQHAELAFVLTVIIVAAFWRAILRLVIAMVAAVVVVSVAYVVIALVRATHA